MNMSHQDTNLLRRQIKIAIQLMRWACYQLYQADTQIKTRIQMILNSSDMGSISSSLCFVWDVIVCKLFALQFSDPEIHNDEIGNWCGRGNKGAPDGLGHVSIV